MRCAGARPSCCSTADRSATTTPTSSRHLDWLTEEAQVIYLDLRGHGRSAPTAPNEWSLERCADDVAARLRSARHRQAGRPRPLNGCARSPCCTPNATPGHAAGVVRPLCGFASWDHARLVAGFRKVAGDEVAALADVSYSGGEVSEEEWDRVFAVFGPHVPDEDTMVRRVGHAELGPYGMERVRAVDLVDGLGGVETAILVVVGAEDPVTPVAAAEEIVHAVAPGRARLEVLPEAGHFPWLDQPDRLRAVLSEFVAGVSAP